MIKSSVNPTLYAELQSLIENDPAYIRARIEASIEAALTRTLRDMPIRDTAEARETVTQAAQDALTGVMRDRSHDDAPDALVFLPGRIRTLTGVDFAIGRDVTGSLSLPRSAEMPTQAMTVAEIIEMASDWFGVPQHMISVDEELSDATVIVGLCETQVVAASKITELQDKLSGLVVPGVLVKVIATSSPSGCDDCKGSGWYVGLTDRFPCPTCSTWQ